MSHDPVNHPSHYNYSRYEVIDVIEDWKLSFHLGNAVKYIARAERKGSYSEDLRKAIWYLAREIQRHQVEELKNKKDQPPDQHDHGPAKVKTSDDTISKAAT